jgi:hypothetical protein
MQSNLIREKEREGEKGKRAEEQKFSLWDPMNKSLDNKEETT